MNGEERLKDLAEFLKNCQYTNLFVAAKLEDHNFPLVQQLNLHEKVTREFKENLIELLNQSLPELRLREYLPGYKPEPREWCYLNLAHEPKIANLIEAMAQIEQPEMFSEQDYFIKHLKFYLIIASDTHQKKSIFFRTYSAKKELSRSGLFGLMMNQGQYNKLNQKIFLFDGEVDCFTWEGLLFIKNIYYFQRIFNYFDQLRHQATETLKLVTTQIPIKNQEAFEKACTTQLSMMEKLSRIAKKPYLKSLTLADIQRTIQEFKLDIEVVGKNQEAQLVFDPHPQKRWLILKLLDDDYLDSTLTRKRYEVNSKRPISQPPS